MEDIEQLSESEFRAKLYHSLQKKGILDSLKVRLVVTVTYNFSY